MNKYIPTCVFCGTTCKKDKATGEYMTDKPCPKCGHNNWKIKDCADLFGTSTRNILFRLKREGAINETEFEKLSEAIARKKNGPKKGKVIDMAMIKKQPKRSLISKTKTTTAKNGTPFASNIYLMSLRLKSLFFLVGIVSKEQ